MRYKRNRTFGNNISDLVSFITSRRSISMISFLLVILALPAIVLLVNYQTSFEQNAAISANVVIDYTKPIVQLDPIAIGMDETGYESPNVLANDVLEQQRLKSLQLGYMRMDLKYTTSADPTSKIICGGGGCDTRWSGDQWINSIKGIGAEPVVIVYPKSSTDAANMVQHFNKDTNNPIHYWIIGNEPNINGYSVQSYSNYFNQDYDAMKAVDPTIKVGGGTTAWYDQYWLQQFLQLSGTRIDFVDFHGYPQQGNVPGDIPTLFRRAGGYGKDVTSLRSVIQSTVPSRASQITIEVGEWDLNWGGSAQDDSNFHAVWTADVIGGILQAGGHSLYYGTKGNALYTHTETKTDSYGHSVPINLDDTNASYHGHGMFTGEGLFRHFGITMVNAASLVPNVDVFASDNPKNIVMVNKDASNSAIITVSLAGVTQGTIDIWRKDESVIFTAPPAKLDTIQFSNGTFSYNLPPFSVTTFLVNPNTIITQQPLSQTTATGSIPSPTPKPTVILSISTSTPTLTPNSTPTPTPQLISGLIAQDTFHRANQSKWGSASDGHVWGADANTLNNFSVRNNAGVITNAWNTLSGILGTSAANAEVLFTGSMSSFHYSNIGSVLRFKDSKNWYKSYINGSNLIIQRDVNGKTAILAATRFSAKANTAYSLRFRIVGTKLYAKTWPAASSEPSTWNITATDSTFTVGYCGLRSTSQQGISASYVNFTAITL